MKKIQPLPNQKELFPLTARKRLYLPMPELLLCHQIPKPLHQCAPRNVKCRAWWDAERERAFAMRGEQCWACGGDGKREIHERYDVNYKFGKMFYLGPCALCVPCHRYIHRGFLQVLVDKGKMSHHYADSVIERGRAILLRAGLPTDPVYPDESECAPWKSWKMIIDNTEYGPSTLSFEEWKAKFGIDQPEIRASMRDKTLAKMREKVNKRREEREAK
jgi:hypothetical protein